MTKTTRTAALGILALALLAAAPAAGQDDGIQEDARMERVRTRLSAQVAEQIQARVQAAREQGLPVGPLLDKAVEGIAKGVPGPRIAGAVDQLAGELGQARALLGNGPPVATDVAAVADAMRRGVPQPAISRIAQRSGPGEPVALAVHTLGDLMDRGVPADQAVAVLEAWRGRGARSEELRELPGSVERLMRQGVLPAQAAAAVANAMRAGHGPMGPGSGGPGAAGPGGGMQGGPPIPPGSGPPSERGQQGHQGGPGNQGGPGTQGGHGGS